MTTNTITVEQEIEAARTARAELEERIIAGDATVTAGDVVAADSAVRFAELRVQADQERASREAAQAREARIAEMQEQLEALANDPGLAKAKAQLEKALAAFCEAATRVERAHGVIYNDVHRLKPGWHTYPSVATIDTPQGTYRKPDPEQVVIDMTRNALRAAGWRDGVRIGKTN